MTTDQTGPRPFAIGVRVSPVKLTGVIIDLDGEIVPLAAAAAEQGVMTRELHDTRPTTVIEAVAALSTELSMAAPDLGGPVVGLGVTVGGHVHGDIGEVHFSPSLRWKAVSLTSLLVESTGLEAVNVENDAKTLAVAEQLFGDGGGVGSFAVVRVHTGVGCGLVIDNELYRGKSGLAGELGHLILEPGGILCPCGGKGCLQTIASRNAMLGAVRTAGGPSLSTAEELASLAHRGDDVAAAAIERGGAALGRGLSMLLNLLNLELVLLYAEEALLETPAYLPSVQASLNAHAFSSAARDCRIMPKELTDVLEARAAASMAFQRFYSSS
jgi:predicted NBD/HSP70 family sugar kinase